MTVFVDRRTGRSRRGQEDAGLPFDLARGKKNPALRSNPITKQRYRDASRCPGTALPVALLCVTLLTSACSGRRGETIVVGSKNFPEQALLGEILAQQIEARTHLRVERRFYLAGSFICQQALLAGRIDTYVEYTGTALTAILHDPIESDPTAVLAKVKQEYMQRFKFEVMPSLGFNNTFAMVVRGEDARRLNVHTLSDAVPYASQWRAGFGYEFMERPDGYPGMAKAYGLHFASTRILDLGLLYRALLDKQVDVVAGNSTDGLLAARDLTILQDDRHYFPPYEAVPIVREETLARYPEVREVINELTRKISDAEMQKMNYAVAGQGKDVTEVAHEFLRGKGLD
jgi:glycine betaine/choline ABC-type transport system substrate-binding protein